MSKIANWMKQNPGMTGGGALLVIAIIAFLVWFFVFREKGGKPTVGPGVVSSVVPQLDVSGTKTVKSVNTSGYVMKRYEYAELGEYLGNNIDFTVTVNTKGGFDENSIDGLTIVKYKADGTTKLGEIKITGVKNYKTYTGTIRGITLTEDAVESTGGDNILKVFGTIGDTEYDPDTTTVGVQHLAEATQNIAEGDLNYTVSTAQVNNFAFDMSKDAGATLFSTVLGDVTRTRYVLSIDANNSYSLIKDTDGYKFKDESSNFLTVDGAFIFKLDKFGDKYRLYVNDTMVTRTNGTGALVLKKPSDMTPDEADMALITMEKKSIVPSRAWLIAPNGNMVWMGTNGAVGQYGAWDDPKTIWDLKQDPVTKKFWLIFNGNMVWAEDGKAAFGYYGAWDDPATLWDLKQDPVTKKYWLIKGGRMWWVTASGLASYGAWDDPATLWVIKQA
tara:strand:+ start:1665 stop:2999 length:1335 start_codon:yes stop_codon:yes gene_type:complete